MRSEGGHPKRELPNRRRLPVEHGASGFLPFGLLLKGIGLYNSGKSTALIDIIASAINGWSGVDIRKYLTKVSDLDGFIHLGYQITTLFHPNGVTSTSMGLPPVTGEKGLIAETTLSSGVDSTKQYTYYGLHGPITCTTPQQSYLLKHIDDSLDLVKQNVDKIFQNIAYQATSPFTGTRSHLTGDPVMDSVLKQADSIADNVRNNINSMMKDMTFKVVPTSEFDVTKVQFGVGSMLSLQGNVGTRIDYVRKRDFWNPASSYVVEVRIPEVKPIVPAYTFPGVKW